MIETVFLDLILIVVAALAGGLLAHRLRLPLVLGYVSAGVAIGPYTSGPTIAQLPLVETLAQIGVALLLFARGLEFSLEELLGRRRNLLPGAPLQMLLSGAYGIAIALFLRWAWPAALWFGAMVSLSGVIIMRQLLASMETADIQVAQLAANILLVQNLLVVPLILILESVAPGRFESWGFFEALLRGLVLLGLLLLFATQILPRLVAYLRRTSEDVRKHVLLAGAILVSIGLYWAGLPFVFAAFAIGLAFSRSYGQEILARPLIFWQPLFGILFFISMGVLLDLPFILSHLPSILIVGVAIIVGKVLIIAFVAHLLGFRGRTPLLIAFMLSHVSELSLIISQLGFDMGVLEGTQHTFTVTVILLTLLVTPLIWYVLVKQLNINLPVYDAP